MLSLTCLQAKDGNLLNVEIYIDEPTEELTPINNTSLIEEIMRENYFGTDENSDLSMKWNELRQRSLVECVNILCRSLKKETHEILLNEAKNCVLRVSFLDKNLFYLNLGSSRLFRSTY